MATATATATAAATALFRYRYRPQALLSAQAGTCITASYISFTSQSQAPASPHRERLAAHAAPPGAKG